MNKSTLLAVLLISSLTLWKSNTLANQKNNTLNEITVKSTSFDQDDLAKQRARQAEQQRAKEIELQKKNLAKLNKEREKNVKKYKSLISKSEKLEKKIAKQEKTIEKLENNLNNKISSGKINDIQIHKENIKISKAKIKYAELKEDLRKANDELLNFAR